MKSMMLSDIYNLQSFAKQMLFAFLIITVCMLPNAGMGGYLCYCTVLFAMLVVSLLSIDERTNWRKYAFIMPVSRKDYVVSKYIMSFLFILCGIGVALLISYVGYLAGTVEMMPMRELKEYIVVSIVVASLFTCLYIPILLRYGVEKARFIFIGVLLLPGGVISFVALDSEPPAGLIEFLEKLSQFLEKNWYLPLLALIFVVLISIKCSMRALEKKEF